MTYKVVFTRRATYIHVVVTGENTRDNVMNYLKEIKQECQSSGIYRILIEEHLEGPRLETLDVFRIAQNGSIENQWIIREIAYVDMNASGDLMQFAETAAVNRGLSIRVFNNIVEAEKWLQQSK